MKHIPEQVQRYVWYGSGIIERIFIGSTPCDTCKCSTLVHGDEQDIIADKVVRGYVHIIAFYSTQDIDEIVHGVKGIGSSWIFLTGHLLSMEAILVQVLFHGDIRDWYSGNIADGITRLYDLYR